MMFQLKARRSTQALHILTDLNIRQIRRYCYCWPTSVETSDNEDAVRLRGARYSSGTLSSALTFRFIMQNCCVHRFGVSLNHPVCEED